MNQRDEMVELVARTLCERDAGVKPELRESVWHVYSWDAEKVISALESKGYRILSPEAARVAGAALDMAD